MTSFKVILATIAIGLLGSLSVCHAAAITSNGTGGGLWSVGGTWVGGVAPTTGDTVTIADNDTVTADSFFNIGTGVANNTALLIYGTFDIPYDLGTGTMTFRGRVQVDDGYGAIWKIARSSQPYSSANKLTIVIDCPSANNAYIILNQGANPGTAQWYGAITSTNTTTPYTCQTTQTVTSSTDCVTVDIDIDAKAGQQWYISSLANPTQCEYVTVESYNSPTKQFNFTSNFAYTHSTGCYLLNIDRNIVVKSSTTALGGYFYSEQRNNALSYNPQEILSYVRFHDLGATAVPGCYLYSFQSTYTGVVFTSGFWNNNTASAALQTWTDCISVGQRSNFAYYGAFATYQGSSNIYIRCWGSSNSLNGYRAAFYDSGFANTFTDCVAFCSGSAVQTRGVDSVFYNLRMSCIGYNLFSLNAGVSPCSITIDSGTYSNFGATANDGTNNPYWTMSSEQYMGGDCTLISVTSPKTTTLYSNANGYFYDAMSAPSFKLNISNYNGTINDDRVMLGYGIVYKDTTTMRTAGAPGLRFDGTSSSYFKGQSPIMVTFTVPCNALDSVLMRGYTKVNGSYTGDAPYAKLYSSDGSLNTTDTHSLAANTWEFMTAGGVVTTAGAVKVDFSSDLPSASTSYFADYRLYVGNNVYSLGETWLSGYPIASPVASTIDATNVWGASTNTFTTAGTFGGIVGETLDHSIADVRNAVDTSSNTLAGQIAGLTFDDTDILNAINTSSNTIVSEIGAIPTVSTTTIAQGVWNAQIETYQASGSFGEVAKKIWNKVKSIFANQ